GSKELRSSDMACMDNISFAEKGRTLEMLEKIINELNTVKNGYEDSNIKDESFFNPYAIICSGFCNSKLVDEEMLHLHLKGRFKIRNEKLQNSKDIFNKFRPTCKNDNNLIQKWQETIASWKRTEP
ncbi:7134_t:CDS:2, partial [Cetraspora pellucida]